MVKVALINSEYLSGFGRVVGERCVARARLVGSSHCPCCKGFKHSGICSHVLAINHILQKFNVRHHLAPLGQRTEKGKCKGRAKAPPKAVTRVPQREKTESDEEAEQLIARGAKGH